MGDENFTADQALARVNTLPFPEAVEGDTVWQFGYAFVLTADEWVLIDPQPEPPNH